MCRCEKTRSPRPLQLRVQPRAKGKGPSLRYSLEGANLQDKYLLLHSQLFDSIKQPKSTLTLFYSGQQTQVE